ncbi:S-locus glycoprotein, partial [Trema orientale]
MSVFLSFTLICAISLFFFSVSCAVETNISTSQSVSDGRTLVSKEGTFELGFFSPGSSNNRYLGIWYGNINVKTVVWVANRCNPINDSSGLLRINNATGSLELLYQNKSVVWATNSSKQAQEPILELLDSGNLVLKDAQNTSSTTSESFLWQSFDHPSDTFLPGMKLGWDLRTGLQRSLSAWKNFEDPCPGDLSYGFEVESNALPEIYILQGTEKHYRAGPWNGLRFSGVPEMSNNQFYDFYYVYNVDEVYFRYKVKMSLLSRFVLNQTTRNRQQLVWMNQSQNWRVFTFAPENDCDKYNLCGANGNCNMISNKPVCQCLVGYRPKSEEKWQRMDWSEGCVRNSPPNCENGNGNEFVRFDGLKLPETTNSWVNTSMNLKECKAKCLRNCSCMAYSNSDIRGQGSGCIIWFGDLFDIRQIPENEQDLYIRNPASNTKKGIDNRRVKILVVVASIGVVLGTLFVYCICRRTFFKARETYLDKEETEHLELPLFDFATISSATDDFSTENKLGEGGFG